MKTNDSLDDLQAHFERVNLEGAKLVRKLDVHDDLVAIVSALVHKSDFPNMTWPTWLPFDEEYCRNLLAKAGAA